jgi:beta-xylosidase
MSADAQQRPVYHNPVMAGDFPDPSVIRVGDDYWATTTSGNWAPEFPIMHSRDLVNWEVVGAVFQQRPAWEERDFWAPEISQDRGRFYVYYTGRKKGGPLCVGVATADKPDGPYTDHGALVCQDDGSIDPMSVRDEKGERYLIWKEDGNSRDQPTPLWAQKLSDDGTKLVGSKKELIRNDAKSWEGGVVEGAFILRRGDWFYLFYSGNSCCGRRCNYAMGVARSHKLLGPWEKNPANPILAENQIWQCPGHGSIVEDASGRDFLLYHAYQKSDTAFYIGREAMLDEVKWNADNWPTINEGKGPSGQSSAPLNSGAQQSDTKNFSDEFDSASLKAGWLWPQTNAPLMKIESERGGRLVLTSTGKQPPGDALSAVITQPTTSANYVASALVDLNAMTNNSLAGLAAYDNPRDALGIAVGDGKVFVYTRQKGKQRIVGTRDVAGATSLHLRMTVHDGAQFNFGFSRDGSVWQGLGEKLDGSYLEPVRIALTSGGKENATAKFEWVRVTPLN